jgi:hypothetical protein
LSKINLKEVIPYPEKIFTNLTGDQDPNTVFEQDTLAKYNYLSTILFIRTKEQRL